MSRSFKKLHLKKAEWGSAKDEQEKRRQHLKRFGVVGGAKIG